MKAILEFDAPESCKECRLWRYCLYERKAVLMPPSRTRFPDCPLVIKEEGLRWIWDYGDDEDDEENFTNGLHITMCPKCKKENEWAYGCDEPIFWTHCPWCAVKLAPPDSGEERNDNVTTGST